jgi:hypothetical protein
VGIPENLVYASFGDNGEALHDLSVDACQIICNYLGIFEWMWQSMMRCVEECIDSHGGYNLQIKCFQMHVNMDIYVLFWYVELVPKFVHTFLLHVLYRTYVKNI